MAPQQSAGFELAIGVGGGGPAELQAHGQLALGRQPGLRRELQERFTHFFVDEFQDTDPLQAEILLLLTADDPTQSDWRAVRPVPGKLFVVGDPKQSIYRFRRADVELYEEVKRQLLARGAELARLTASFRARPSIQLVVNSAFAPVMQGSDNGSQATYVPLERVRDDVDGQPTVVILPVPRPYGDYGSVVKWRIEESFPDGVGAFVDWLVRESGWTVEEPGKPGRKVPIADRHVCILFRRFQAWGTDVTRPCVRALEARRLPHVLVGGRSFHDREEVLALRNALCSIEWPDDELRVFATMRGPLFALHDDALLSFRHAHGGLRPIRWAELARRESLTGDEREVADALAVVGRLHGRRNRRPIAETITRFLGEVRAHAGLAIWPTGEQALANCLRIVELARVFERRGASSFRAFVESLEEEAEQGRSEEAPVVEEGTEGVRIITVHRAKGLEWDRLFIIWMTDGWFPSNRFQDEFDDLEEERRLLYVATTRAKRELNYVYPLNVYRGPDMDSVPAISRFLEPISPTILPHASLSGG